MKYTTLLYLPLFILLLNACRPDALEIALPEAPAQVVVFSQVIPDQLMTVSLTRTLDALQFSESEGDSLSEDILNNLLVTDATVTVSYRAITDTLLEAGAGFYVSATTPQFTNEVYTLKVVTPEGESLTATNKMLPIVSFKSIQPEVIQDSTGGEVNVAFEIADLPEKNWYMLNFYKPQEVELSGIDLNSFLGPESNLLIKTELLNDDAIVNGTLSGTIELPEVSASDSILVSLSNISESYYQFLEIRKNSDNFLTQITKEPLSLPTNVAGGLGFFNTHFPDLRLFDLNEF